MNAAPSRSRRIPSGWTLFDLALVAVLGILLTLLVVALSGFGLQAAGLADPRAMLREHPVIASAVLGALIYGAFLLVVYLRIVRRPGVGWSGLGFRRPPLLPLALTPLIAIGQLVALAATNAVVISLIGGEIENPQVAAITGQQGFSWLNFGLMLLLAGAIAPLVEEVLFRGLLYGWLRSHLSAAPAVITSAAIFSALHVIPVLLPAIFVIGVVLAIAYEYSDSLWIPILLHAMQNSVVVVLIFVALALNLPIGG